MAAYYLYSVGLDLRRKRVAGCELRVVGCGLRVVKHRNVQLADLPIVCLHSELHLLRDEVQSAKSTTPNRYSKDNRDINY